MKSLIRHARGPALSLGIEIGIADESRAHLVKDLLGGDAAEGREGRLESREPGGHVLARIETEPQEAGIAEGHEERVAHLVERLGRRELGQLGESGFDKGLVGIELVGTGGRGR